VSTGNGRSHLRNSRTTIFKIPTHRFGPKSFSSEIQKKFGLFPFSVRTLDDEEGFHIQELDDDGQLVRYEVLYEEDGNCLF
jgi:hypothetical protein